MSWRKNEVNNKLILNYIFIFFILCISADALEYILKNKSYFIDANKTNNIFLKINGNTYRLNVDIAEIFDYYNIKNIDDYFLARQKILREERIKYAKELKKGLYDLQHLKYRSPIKLSKDLNWSENPFNDRNWQYELHTLKFLENLMTGYEATHDEWYIARLKFLVKDWWKDNFKVEYPSKEFSWYNHTIPIRLHEFLRVFEYLRSKEKLDIETMNILLKAIYYHAEILANEKELYMKHHNHGLTQAFNLFEASAILPEFTKSKYWKKIALQRLKDEINFALTKNGIHKENSPGYHKWVSPYCASANAFVYHYLKKNIVKDMNHKSDVGLLFLSVITKPNGYLPDIGDTTENATIENVNYPNMANYSSFPLFKYIITQGQEGHKPENNEYFFKEAGYYIFRNQWDFSEINDTVHFVEKCGFEAIGHRHNDDGNILLYAYGENWLIDAGMYGYKYDKYRRYVTSASAHNVSFPLTEKITYLSDKYLLSLLKKKNSIYREWGIEKKDGELICRSHMYLNYDYIRKTRVINDFEFYLEDNIVPHGNVKHPSYFFTLFRTTDDKNVYKCESNKIIIQSSKHPAHALEIIPLDKNIQSYLFEGENGEIISLTTDTWQKMTNIKTIAFVDKNVSYHHGFILKLIKNNYSKHEACTLMKTSSWKLPKTKINFIEKDNDLYVNVRPVDENIEIAYYLYSESKKIDIKWYKPNNEYVIKNYRKRYRTLKLIYFLRYKGEKIYIERGEIQLPPPSSE